MNGKGRKINGDGDYYEGDWIDNKYHGKVSYIFYSYRENMYIQTEQFITGIGYMMCNKDMESKHGMMELNLKEIIRIALKMVLVVSIGRMGQNIKENL